ncbi:TPA: hypothetical protein QC211_005786, partial [Bacillus cereus]|nr:hypothetical protein [Bacillus cereus]
YREQKEVAYSLFKRKKSLPIQAFLYITFLLVISNVFLLTDQKSDGKLPDWIVVYLTTVSVLWIMSAYASYKNILRNINVSKEFQFNTSKIKKGFKNIENAFDTKKEESKKNHKFAGKIKKDLNEISIASEICF